jgi:hypothetical protein
VGQAQRAREPVEEAHPLQGGEPSVTGTYLTDGRSLFRVQHAITEADGLHLDEPLLELEDCATLELILCSAGALERLGLRPVTPSLAARRARGAELALSPRARP